MARSPYRRTIIGINVPVVGFRGRLARRMLSMIRRLGQGSSCHSEELSPTHPAVGVQTILLRVWLGVQAGRTVPGRHQRRPTPLHGHRPPLHPWPPVTMSGKFDTVVGLAISSKLISERS